MTPDHVLQRKEKPTGNRWLWGLLQSAFTILMCVAGSLPGNNLLAADSRPSASQTTERGIEEYFRWNGLTNSAALRVGMKLDDAIKLLGEPTSHVRDGRLIPGTPQYPFEGWLRWYNNPREVHVAPSIRLRIEKGFVKEVQTSRG